MEVWKSPRVIEQDIKQYKYKKFEDYMTMADNGELSRQLAITAFREEIEYSESRTD